MTEGEPLYQGPNKAFDLLSPEWKAPTVGRKTTKRSDSILMSVLSVSACGYICQVLFTKVQICRKRTDKIN